MINVPEDPKKDALLYVSLLYKKTFEIDKWEVTIPYLKFKEDWNVKIVPSFMSIIRFQVYRNCSNKKIIDVFLDCYSLISFSDEPYWEIYPFKGDVFRCNINETEDLLNAIDFALGNRRFQFLNQ